MGEWFGASWQTIGYVVGGTVAMYLSTLIAARIAGRRTLAQLSAFDAIITIAIGSLLASTSVHRDPSYGQGVAVLLTLLVLQLVVAAGRRRFALLSRLVEFEPELVVRHGEVRLDRNPLGAQLTRGELESALRQHGIFDVANAFVVVLEPSGKFSVGAQGPDSDVTADALTRRKKRLA